MGPVVIIHLLDDNYRKRWVFAWKGRDVVLQRYYHEHQANAASYKLIEFFDGEDQGADYGDWKWLTEAEVPWDDDLKGEVCLAIMSRLRICRPSEKTDD